MDPGWVELFRKVIYHCRQVNQKIGVIFLPRNLLSVLVSNLAEFAEASDDDDVVESAGEGEAVAGDPVGRTGVCYLP